MEMAHEGMIWSLAWHPLGHILCSGSNDHTRLDTRDRSNASHRAELQRCSAPPAVSDAHQPHAGLEGRKWGQKLLPAPGSKQAPGGLLAPSPDNLTKLLMSWPFLLQ